jgi:F0F1-type ATP synthase membrane subunit b/b'
VDVHRQLAELREAIETARSMPMSSSAVVNRAEILGMLDQLQARIEQAFLEAQRVVADREGVVDEGRRQADLIVHDAENERDRLVSDTEVFRLAQHKAETMLNDAKVEAEAMRAETDEYVDTKLANFEITLERTLEAVKRGRDRLSGTTVMHSLTPEEADKIVLPEHLAD